MGFAHFQTRRVAMIGRMLMAGLVVAMCATVGFAADDTKTNTEQGFVVTAGQGLIKVATDKTQPKKAKTYTVNALAKISFEGNPSKLEDLKTGWFVICTKNRKGELTTIAAYKKQPKSPKTP